MYSIGLFSVPAVALPLHTPCVIQGIMTIAAAAALNCDNGTLKYAVEKVGVQLIIELFQKSSKPTVFCQFLHIRSLSSIKLMLHSGASTHII